MFQKYKAAGAKHQGQAQQHQTSLPSRQKAWSQPWAPKNLVQRPGWPAAFSALHTGECWMTFGILHGQTLILLITAPWQGQGHGGQWTLAYVNVRWQSCPWLGAVTRLVEHTSTLTACAHELAAWVLETTRVEAVTTEQHSVVQNCHESDWACTHHGTALTVQQTR